MRFPRGGLIFYCFPKNIQKHENTINITFLIKSIMNKKLFSWKALAGLALLVAMGLTSCKQGTEVDPTDPYNTSKPTTPSISTKGTADVTITITAAGDLATQWASLDAAKVKELREKTTLNVAINNAGYKLEGAVIALPNFFSGADNGATGKIVNITFNNGFQNAGYGLTQTEYPIQTANEINADKKSFLNISTANLAGNLVNFFFPAGNFDLVLDASKTETTLNSEAGANIGILTASAGTSKSALKIKGGIAVDGIALSAGDVKVEGGSLAAKVADVTGNYPFNHNNWNWATGGFAVGANEIIYVKSLIVDRGVVATVNAGLANYQGTADAITIKKNGGVILSDTDPHVGSIKGLNANATVALAGSNSDWSGWNTDMNNIGSFEKVVLTNNRKVRLANTDKFNTVEFVNAVTTNGNSFANVTFNTLNIPVSKDDQTYTFSKVNFKGVVNVTGNYSQTIASTTKTWQWIVDGTGGGYWSEVTSAAPLKAYNANEDVQEFTSTAVNPTEGSAVLGGNNTGAVTSKVIKITYNTNVKLYPDNTLIALSSDCKILGDAVDGSNINNAFGKKALDEIWYNVSVDGVVYKWKQNATDGKYWLIKP